jgi:hypothetical protein
MRTEKRQAQQAVQRFEEKKKDLYRRDDSKRFRDDEHDERLAALTAALQGEIETLIERAEKDASKASQEEEALKASCTDPTANLTATQAARFAALTPLVREDCERLPCEELSGRLRVLASEVSATGSIGTAAALFARYGDFRARALEEHLDRAARGEVNMTDEEAARQNADLTGLQEAVRALEEQLVDPSIAERRERASRAARESRELAESLRRRLAQVDGTDAAAYEAGRERIAATL